MEEDIAQAITATLNAGERLPFSTIRSTFNTRCMEKTEYIADGAPGFDQAHIGEILCPEVQGVLRCGGICHVAAALPPMPER